MYTSNDINGDNFIYGIRSYDNEMANSIELFTKFIIKNGFTAWHVHNGWLTHNYQSGSVLVHENLDLTWCDEQSGYCHSRSCPNLGDKIVVINGSSNPEQIKPFDLYCYVVVEKRKSLFDKIKIKRVEIKQVIFNWNIGEYEFYQKKNYNPFKFINQIFK